MKVNDSLLNDKTVPLETTHEDLVVSQSMLEKINADSGKLNEILVAGKKSERKCGIGCVEKKGKIVMKNQIVFVKATNNIDQETYVDSC